MRRALLVGLVVLAGCGVQDVTLDDGDEVFDGADAPLLGETGQDGADRGCNVVLRSLERTTNVCSSGVCWWAWKGVMDVSAQAVAEGAKAKVLFKNQDASSWSGVSGTKVSGAPAGFQRYSFKLWRNGLRDGMSATAYTRGKVEVAPYLLTTSGARVFDHNRYPGDFDNYALTQDGGWRVAEDPAVCAPRPALAPSLDFEASWRTTQRGALVAGQPMVVTYALSRLPTCRGTHNGYPAWDLVAFVRFVPSGTVVEGTVRGFDAPNGVPSNSGAKSVPFETLIPSGTTAVEVWFKNFTGAGSTCEAWDSNYGANYRFDVEARALPKVQWAGNGGSSFSRACTREDGVPANVVMDSYVQQRACSFVTADVYVPGVTDAAVQKPWAVYARAVLSLDGVALDPASLAFVGRVGNDYRYQFEVPKSALYYGPKWSVLTYTLRFSTDGARWTEEPSRTVTRDVSFCNPAWGSCSL